MKIRRVIPLLAALLLAACTAATPSGGGLSPATLPPPPPTEATPTAAPALSPSPTPTLAAPESLTSAELHQRLDPFGGATPDCALPCYNGLLVGRSGLPEALNFYARLGIGIPDLIPGDYEAIQDGSGRLGAWLLTASDVVQATQAGLTPPLVDLYVEGGVVQSVYVGWSYIPAYLTPTRVLEVLGQPTQIDLALAFEGDAPQAMLRFLYTSLQTGFAFYAAAERDDDGWRICFSEARPGRAFLGIFAPEVPPMAGLTYSERLLPLLETLGIAYEDFAAQMAAHCVGLSAEQGATWQALPAP